VVGGELGVGLVDGVAWLVAVLVVGVSCFGGDVELVCSVDAGTLGSDSALPLLLPQAANPTAIKITRMAWGVRSGTARH